MAMNLEAVLRIAARTEGLNEVAALSEGIRKLGHDGENSGRALESVSAGAASWRSDIAAKTATIAALGLGLFASTKHAIDFQSSMADVRKVVDGISTPKAFAEISEEILGLSRQMPLAASGFAEIYAAAGRSGVARDELRSFAVLVAQVGIAFDLTADEAGTALGQIRSALGLTLPEMRKLMDAMNTIDDSTGASANQLIDFMTRSGAVGKIAGLTAQQTAAFGAAMIQAGIDSEIAGTSFNNMIKALSRGPSMTDRQVDALRRLGYSMNDAASIESELTRTAERESRRRVDDAKRQGDEVVRVAEEQSRRRIEVAREETSQLNREINRRYRDQLQALQDNWDDQAAAREEALQDQADAQIKALQREQEQIIRAAEERAKAMKSNADAEVDAIRDSYDKRIDEIRDSLDRQLTLERRAARNQQQQIRDGLQDREEAEVKAANKRLDVIEELEERKVDAERKRASQRLRDVEATEQSILDKARAAAKKTGQELAAASGQGFADRLQQDAIGTIMEVFSKIANLPRSQQISVLSDLFGDEARGLAPMINNLDELQRILKIASDESKYAGSVAREYGIRSETAANQLKLFNNAVDELKIAFGTALLPLMTEVVKILTPLVNGLSSVTKASSGLITALTTFAGLGFILKPVIGSLITITALVSGLFSLFTMARWGASLQILAFMPTPLRLITSALVALGLAASPLGPIINTVVIALTAFQVLKFVGAIIGGFTGIVTWLTGTFLPAVIGIFSGPVGWTVLAIAAITAMCIAFREPLGRFFTWLGEWAKGIPGAWNTNVIEPLKAQWTAFVAASNEKLQAFLALFQAGWTAVVKWWQSSVVQPIGSAWNGMVQGIQGGMRATIDWVLGAWTGLVNGLRGLANAFLAGWVNAINGVIGGVNNLIAAFNNLPGPDIGLIPTMALPAFAEGGYVTRPMTAIVGEGGQPEYIVPANKMAAASAAYLSGARGTKVLSSTSAAPQAAGPVRIDIQTGPVMRTADGQDWVTVDDLERAMRATAQSVLGRVRTPAGRRATGIR